MNEAENKTGTWKDKDCSSEFKSTCRLQPQKEKDVQHAVQS